MAGRRSLHTLRLIAAISCWRSTVTRSEHRTKSIVLALALAVLAFGVLGISNPRPVHAASYPSMWLKFDCEYTVPQPFWVDTVHVMGYNQNDAWRNQQFYSYWTGIDNNYWWWLDGSYVYYTVTWHTGPPFNHVEHSGSGTFQVPYYPSVGFWTVFVPLC